MSLGIAKCLADVLRNDIVSIPASTFVVNYPTLFKSATAVPTHLYTCLKDIYLGSASMTTPASTWNQWVVETFGFGFSGSQTIAVIPTRIIDQADVNFGPKSNTPGAEFAEVYLYLKKGGPLYIAVDEDRLANAELRIRRLLDYNYRTNITGTPEIPITDLSINPNSDIKAYWQGIVNPINDQNIAALYYCFYTRIFVK